MRRSRRKKVPDPFNSQKYHPNEWPLLNAYTAVWYQEPGVGDYYEAVPPEKRSGYFVPASPKKP